jgi:hypothetical protein
MSSTEIGETLLWLTLEHVEKELTRIWKLSDASNRKLIVDLQLDIRMMKDRVNPYPYPAG